MSKKKEPAQPTVFVRLELSPELHAKLRVLAAENGLPMSQFVRQLVEERILRKK